MFPVAPCGSRCSWQHDSPPTLWPHHCPDAVGHRGGRQGQGRVEAICDPSAFSIYIFLRQILTFWTIFCDILKSDSCTIFTRPKLLANILQFKYGRDHLVFWLWQSWSLMNVTRAKTWAPRFEWSPECTIQYKENLKSWL